MEAMPCQLRIGCPGAIRHVMNLPRVFASVAAVLIALLCPALSAFSQTTNGIQEKELTHLLATVADWPNHFPDSNGIPYVGWDRLVAVARDVQKKDSGSVTQALRACQTTNTGIDRKLFLLLRMIFELAENVPEAQSEMSGGWITASSNINSDGTINMAWPITWNHGKPKLVCGAIGLQGPRFDAAAEYEYFQARYPMRNLSLFNLNGDK